MGLMFQPRARTGLIEMCPAVGLDSSLSDASKEHSISEEGASRNFGWFLIVLWKSGSMGFDSSFLGVDVSFGSRRFGDARMRRGLICNETDKKGGFRES